MGSTKNALVTFKAIDAGDLSGDVTGPTTNITFLDNISVQIIFTGTPTGTFYIQGSNVANSGGLIGNGPGTNDWVTVPVVDETGVVTLSASGAAGQYLANLFNLGFAYLRVIYDFTSGTGDVDVWINGKSI